MPLLFRIVLDVLATAIIQGNKKSLNSKVKIKTATVGRYHGIHGKV